MPDQARIDAIKQYLSTYSGQFSEEALIDQLKKAGYTDDEISAVENLSQHVQQAEELIQPESTVQGGEEQDQITPVQTSQPIQTEQLAQEQVQPFVDPQASQPQMPQNQFIESQAQFQAPQMIGSDYMSGGSSSNKKTMIIAVAVVLAIILGVVGYGFWNGSNIKNFAKKAQGYVDTVKEWSGSLTGDFSQVSEDATEILAELKKGAPGKAKRLHTNLTDYFTHSKSLAEALKGVKGYDDYEEFAEKITDEDKKFMEEADKVQKEIEEDIEKLKDTSFSF